MASPNVLDFDRLLAPIPGENPAGTDPRRDHAPNSLYRQFRDAGKRAREAERRVVHDESDLEAIRRNPPDWKPVLDLGLRLLSDQAKDLEVASLLTEALVRKYGYPGLRDAFRLSRELVERFWESLYPLPDEEEGVGGRVAALAQLNGLEGAKGPLITPIFKVPITEGKTTGSFSLFDYRQAQEVEGIQDPTRRAERLEQLGGATVAAFNRSVTETPPEFFRTLLEDLSQCCEEFQGLTEALDARCAGEGMEGSAAPPSSNIREALESCRDEAARIARPILGEGEQAGAEGAGPEGAAGGAGLASGPVRNREEAFRCLLQVAEFFKRTEPHSPVSYALEQAVRWGRMPLPELLHELIPEDAVRGQLFKLVGIVPRREEPRQEE